MSVTQLSFAVPSWFVCVSIKYRHDIIEENYPYRLPLAGKCSIGQGERAGAIVRGFRSGPQDQPLLRDDRSRPSDRRVLGDLVHEGVVMPRVVMENHQGAYVRRVGEAHTLLPGRVAPVPVARIFGVGVGRVV